MDNTTNIDSYKERSAKLETLTCDEAVHTSRKGKRRNKNNGDDGDGHRDKEANDGGDRDEKADDHGDEHKDEKSDDHGDEHKEEKADDHGDEHKDEEPDDDEHKDEEPDDDEHKDEKACGVRTKLIGEEVTLTPSGTKFRWRKMSRKQIFIMMAMNSTYLLSRLNYSLLAPLFPKEANEKGVNATITGWIFGVFALVQFIVSPFYRRLILIFGGKSLLLLGLFLCGSCTIGFGLLTFIDTTNGIVLYVVTCFAMQILLAVSCTLIDNTCLVMLVQYFPENFATLMGVGEIFTGIGFVSGPALGALLYTSGGYITPFAIAGGTALLALPVYWKFVPEENVAPNVEDTDQPLPILKLLLHPVSVINSVVLIVGAIAWSVLNPTLEPHLRQHEVLPVTVGMMFLVMAAFYSITSPIWGRIADLIQEKRILNVTGMILSSLGFFWIGPSPVLRFSSQYNYVWYTAIAVGVIGAASGMCVIATYSIYIIVLREIGFPENNKSYGMVSALWISVYSLGWFIGPCLGGFLLDHIGFEWLVTCTAVICLITCLLVGGSLLAERYCSNMSP